MSNTNYWVGYSNVDEMTKAAFIIWDAYKNQMNNSKAFQNMEGEDRLREYQIKYPKFHRQFPIVLRYMVFFGRFYKKSFKKYVTKLVSKPTSSMDEKLSRQSEYIAKYLYREESKQLGGHFDSRYSRELQTNIYEALKKEKKDFETKHRESQNEVNRCIDLNQQEKKDQLIKFLKEKMKDKEKNG